MKPLKIVKTFNPSRAAFVTPEGDLVEWNGAHGDNAHWMLGHTGPLPPFGGEHFKRDLDKVMTEYGLIRIRPEDHELNIEARSYPTDEQLNALLNYYPDSEVVIDNEFDPQAEENPQNTAIMNALMRVRR